MISLADKLIACGASIKQLGGGSFYSLNVSGIRNETIFCSDISASGDIILGGRSTNSSSPYALGLLLCISKAGAVVWQRTLQYSTHQTMDIRGISLDATGNIYAVGIMGSGLVDYNAFLAKYSSAGALQWVKGISNTGYVNATPSIAVSPSGEPIILVGRKAVTPNDIGVAKYSSSGTLVWSKSLGDTVAIMPVGLACDSIGNVYVYTQRDASGVSHSHLAKLDSSGGVVSQKSFYQNNTYAGGIVVDASDNLYISHRTTPSGVARLTFTKINSALDVQWSKYLDTDGTASSMQMASNGAVFGFGASNKLLSITTAGALVFQRSVAGSSFTGLGGVVSDADGIVLAGSCTIVGGGTGSDGALAVLPTSGDGTGGYGSGPKFTYTETAYVLSDSSLSTAAFSYTVSTINLSTTAETYTDAVPSVAVIQYTKV